MPTSDFDKDRPHHIKTNKPYVIAIKSVSGGGKTALGRLVQQSLPASVLFCFDDFEDTNLYPEDFYEWYKRGGNLLEFDCPGMSAAVEEEVRKGEKQYIVLDYPFGRDHPRFRERIDLSVFIDTPLDLAMARRILRDYASPCRISAEERLDRLREEMAHYLEKGRYVYIATKQKDNSDVVLAGCASLQY